ncbi:MAG: type II toxin-antitoxin system RelE/ParE family toxin [Candidatus Omnitrophota bacterium]
MGNFEVLLMPAALKSYKSCPEELAKRLNKCFEELESNPFWGPNIKVLKGEKRRYRYRVGDYRAIYGIDKEKNKVFVTLIASRASVYRNIN